MVEHPIFNYVENICVVYFTLEYLLRLWVAPKKLAFVKEFLNIIDLLAIMPFMFEVILILVSINLLPKVGGIKVSCCRSASVGITFEKFDGRS